MKKIELSELVTSTIAFNDCLINNIVLCNECIQLCFYDGVLVQQDDGNWKETGPAILTITIAKNDIFLYRITQEHATFHQPWSVGYEPRIEKIARDLEKGKYQLMIDTLIYVDGKLMLKCDRICEKRTYRWRTKFEIRGNPTLMICEFDE